MTEDLSPEDAKRLVALCAAGRLYAVDEWIQAGKFLNVPPELKKTPLRVAMSTGFHSLIELLLRHEAMQQAKNDTLRQAIERRRPDLAELAVAYGAEVASVPFVEALVTGDKRIVTLFLEKGADLVTDFPFAYAFHELRAKTTLGTYLDCKRHHPELADKLQEQADMALRQFCKDGNLKWVSLLMWAGADPRSTGPTLDDVDDPDMYTTAFHEACTSGHLEVLKRLKPDPGRDDLGSMLEDAALLVRREIITYLLSLGANPNNRSDGSSSALDACIRHLGWEDKDRILHRYGPHHLTPAYKVIKTREAIRLLIERGAHWRPDSDSLKDARRILYKIDPEVTVELAGLLATHRACEDALLHHFLRAPRMQQHLASCEPQMGRVGLTLDGSRRSEVQETRAPRPSAHALATYKRERLYKEVWAEPTQKVAARYGISDVALARACRHLQIPKPPRGYWAKKAARQAGPRPKLLPLRT
jgi:hypothetical protein